jgi:hypothetical protein
MMIQVRSIPEWATYVEEQDEGIAGRADREERDNGSQRRQHRHDHAKRRYQ